MHELAEHLRVFRTEIIHTGLDHLLAEQRLLTFLYFRSRHGISHLQEVAYL